jgi:putative thioredoxin
MHNDSFDFQRDVIEVSNNIPVVVDFWAEWCGPCRILGPVLEKLAAAADGRWQLVKIDTEEQQEIAGTYRIQSIPAVKMFSDGAVVAEFVGALPENQITNWLEQNLPTESKKQLAEAEAALRDGDVNRAKELLRKSISADNQNITAKVMLAKLIVTDDPEHAWELTEAIPVEHPGSPDAEAVRTIVRLTRGLPELEQRAQQPGEPADAWSLYFDGIKALAGGDYENALQHFIETLQITRDIDDDGPRKACIALFSVLGQKHALTQKYHRSFTSALF